MNFRLCGPVAAGLALQNRGTGWNKRSIQCRPLRYGQERRHAAAGMRAGRLLLRRLERCPSPRRFRALSAPKSAGILRDGLRHAITRNKDSTVTRVRAGTSPRQTGNVKVTSGRDEQADVVQSACVAQSTGKKPGWHSRAITLLPQSSLICSNVAFKRGKP